MTQHYPRSTVSVSHFCKKCQKYTQHKVDDARLGVCLECVERLEKLHESAKPRVTMQQRSLWGEVL